MLRPFLFLSLILCACLPGGLSHQVPHPTSSHDPPVETSTIAPATEVPSLEDNATVSPSYPRNCGYQWAQKALPELSKSFEQSIQALQAEAQANVFAFGEDCIYEDGSSIFIPMETDFNIMLQGGNLSDEAVGEWIVRVMQIIDSIPPDQIVGPRPGRVGITIEANGERKAAGFYIDQYHALPPGLNNAEVFQALQTQQ